MNKLYSYFFVLFVASLFLVSGCSLADLKKAINPKATAGTEICPVECATETEPSDLCPAECIPVWEDKTPEVIVIGENENNGTTPTETTTTPETETPEEETPVVEEEKPGEETVEAGTVKFEVLEGAKVSLASLRAVDPDGIKVTYTYEKPFNSVGEWQTKIGDAGKYTVTITASDGKMESSQKVLVVVNPVNKAPIIKNFNDVTVKEGETVTFNPEVSDPEGEQVKIKYSGWMTSNSYKTTFKDAGVYDVTLTASDGKAETKKTIKVTVVNLNRAPVLDKIQGIATLEGEKITIVPVYSDPDGDEVTVSFSKPFDSSGKWQTEVGDKGTYNIDVTASDGVLSTTEKVLVIVTPKNLPPVIEPIADIMVTEGDTIKLTPKVSDPNGDQFTVKYSGWMTTSTYTTNYNDAGTHTVKVTASDGKDESSITVNIEVKDKNRGICWCFGEITPECKDICAGQK